MFRNKILFIIAVILSISSGSFSALYSNEIFEAKIFREGSEKTDFLFYYRNKIYTDGAYSTLIHDYYSQDESLFAREEVVFEFEELLTHKTEFYELEEYSLLQKNGSSMDISFRKDSKEKAKTIDYKEDMVFGPTQQNFIRENLDKFQAGSKVSFSLPVPEFTTTADFTMEEVKNTKYGRPGKIVLKMETKNFFLRLIVGKNYFVIDSKSGLIEEIHGPSVLKVYENGKWNYVDVEIYFEYIN